MSWIQISTQYKVLRTNSSNNSNNIQEQQHLRDILVRLQVCLRINRIGLSSQIVVSSNSNLVHSRILISLAILNSTPNLTTTAITTTIIRPLQVSRILTQVLNIFNLLAQSQSNQMTRKSKKITIIMMITTMQMLLLLIQVFLMMLLISESKERGSI